jgi:hypothetical protein
MNVSDGCRMQDTADEPFPYECICAAAVLTVFMLTC